MQEGFAQGFKELNLMLNCTPCNIQASVKLFCFPFLLGHRWLILPSSEVLTIKDEKNNDICILFEVREKSRPQETTTPKRMGKQIFHSLFKF